MHLRSVELLDTVLKNRGMTRSQLANGRCHRSFITQLCNGARSGCSPELAAAFAKVLRVPVDLLFESTPSDKIRRPAKRRQAGRAA